MVCAVCLNMFLESQYHWYLMLTWQYHYPGPHWVSYCFSFQDKVMCLCAGLSLIDLKMYLYFMSHLNTPWPSWWKSTTRNTANHQSYVVSMHSCWWPGVVRGQGISCHGIDIVTEESRYQQACNEQNCLKKVIKDGHVLNFKYWVEFFFNENCLHKKNFRFWIWSVSIFVSTFSMLGCLNANLHSGWRNDSTEGRLEAVSLTVDELITQIL